MIWFSFPVFLEANVEIFPTKETCGRMLLAEIFRNAFQTSKVLVDPSISMEPEIDEPNLCNFHQPLR